MNLNKTLTQGAFFHLCSILLMATGPVFNKFGMRTLTPLVATAWCCLFVCLFSLASLKKIQIEKIRHNLGKIMATGALNACAFTLFFFSLKNLDPGTVAFLNRSYVVFMVIIGVIYFKEELDVYKGIFFLFALSGIAMFSYKGLEFSNYYFVGATILSGFLMCVSNIIAKSALRTCEASCLIFTTNLVSLLLLILFILALDNSSVSYFHPDVIFIAGGALFWGYWGVKAFYNGLSSSQLSTTGIFRAFTPLLTSFYALPFFTVKYTALNVVGGCFLISSVVFIGLVRSRNPHKAL